MWMNEVAGITERECEGTGRIHEGNKRERERE